MLKQRLRTIERKVMPRPKARLWIVSVPKEKTEARIKRIKAGAFKNKDGTFFNPGDSIYIISSAYIPRFSKKGRPVRKKKPSLTDIERIEVLIKRKQDLKQQLRLREKEKPSIKPVGTSFGSAVISRSD